MFIQSTTAIFLEELKRKRSVYSNNKKKSKYILSYNQVCQKKKKDPHLKKQYIYIYIYIYIYMKWYSNSRVEQKINLLKIGRAHV